MKVNRWTGSATWSNDEMLAALRRVYAILHRCTQTDYSVNRLDTDPSERTIRCRFGTFNAAKQLAGLPVTAKTRKTAHNLTRGLSAPQLIPYSCHRCGRVFRGAGRRKGHWHCEACRLKLTELSCGIW